MDETLPDTLHMTCIYLMILLTSLGIVTASIPYYAVMVFALIASFFMMQVTAGWAVCACNCFLGVRRLDAANSEHCTVALVSTI